MLKNLYLFFFQIGVTSRKEFAQKWIGRTVHWNLKKKAKSSSSVPFQFQELERNGTGTGQSSIQSIYEKFRNCIGQKGSQGLLVNWVEVQLFWK